MPNVGTPGIEQRRVDLRGALGVHRRRAAGEDDRLRALGEHLRDRHRRRHDLAEDPALADPPRDELGVLRAEVHDQDGVEAVRRCRHCHLAYRPRVLAGGPISSSVRTGGEACCGTMLDSQANIAIPEETGFLRLATMHR